MVHDGVVSALGKAIKAERERRGWSQKVFASMAGVHYQTVAAVENGRFASTYRAEALCKVLGTTLARLMRDVAAAHVNNGGRVMPDVGDLTAILMEVRGIDEDELAALMRVEREDVDDLLAGSCGPQLWGAAAVALDVTPLAYDMASLDGVEAALRYLGIPSVVDRPVELPKWSEG